MAAAINAAFVLMVNLLKLMFIYLFTIKLAATKGYLKIQFTAPS